MYIRETIINKSISGKSEQHYEGQMKEIIDLMISNINFEELKHRANGSTSIDVEKLVNVREFSEGSTEKEISQILTFYNGGYRIRVVFDEYGKYLLWQLFDTEKHSHYQDEKNIIAAKENIKKTLTVLKKIFDADYELLHEVGIYPVHKN